MNDRKTPSADVYQVIPSTFKPTSAVHFKFGWINYTWLVQAESSLWKQAGSFALRTQYLVVVTGTDGLMGAFEII